MTSVDPVDTRSTIASARPSRGATSTAPEIGMTSTAIRRSAKKRRAVFGWAVATRSAGEVLDGRTGESFGTAAASRQRP